MPFRNWYKNLAPGYLAVAVLVLSVILAVGDVHLRKPQEKQQPNQPIAYQQTADNSTTGIVPPTSQQNAAANQLDLCHGPGRSPEDDLCQQWRMANAAENQIAKIDTQNDLMRWEIGTIVGTIIVALVAVSVAIHSNYIASNTGKRQLRAYAGNKGAVITMTEDGELSFRVRYTNYGPTPALHVVIRTSCTATPLPLQVPLIPDATPGQTKSTAIMWPNQELRHDGTMIKPGMNLPARFTPEYRDDIATGRAAIFIYGDIHYRDVFGDPHVTTFRLMYTGPWGGKKALTFCDEGNDAS